MKRNIKLCSEPNCFREVDLDEDALKKPDGTYYAPSLKCWDCRTDNDRRNIKDHRRRYKKYGAAGRPKRLTKVGGKCSKCGTPQEIICRCEVAQFREPIDS